MIQVGETIDRFRVVELLGSGGTGSVYKVYDPGLERLIALKVLHAHLLIFPEHAERFRREAVAAAALRHPNIAAVYEIGDTEGVPYIAMEYVSGRSLQDNIAQTGPLPSNHALRILTQIGDALDYAHSAGVVHRDVKPANIIEDDNGRTVLVDFGLVHAMGHSGATRTGAILGSPTYMAPEQALGRPTDARTDMYALGIIAYEMITGEPPFTGPPPAVLHEHAYTLPLAPSSVNAEIPVAVDKTILRALSKDPTDRYQSARLLCAELAEAFGTIDSRRAAPIDAKTRSARPNGRVRRPALLVLASLTVLLGALGLFRYFRGSSVEALPGRPAAAWRMAGGNAARTGFVDARVPPPSQVVWSFDPGAVAGSGPVAAEGSCYFTNLDGAVFAIDIQTGHLRWQARVGPTFSTPAVFAGRLFVASDNSFIEAFDSATGQSVWTFSADVAIRQSPVLTDRLVIVASEGRFFALRSSDGSLLWSADAGWISGSVAATDAAVFSVFFSQDRSLLRALNLNSGATLWEIALNETVVSGLSVEDHRLFLANEYGVLQAVDARNGRRLWSFPTRGLLPGGVATAHGTVYVGSTEGRLYALSSETGVEQWRLDVGRGIESPPLVAGDWIAVGSVDGSIHIANALSGKPVRQLSVGGSIKTPLAFAEGYLFVRGDKLYALGP